ncbi:putative Exoglucanase 3 [Calycina marina]|uniref:Glucanase n=1 Tax=Calycina marina TaxID=1763456 RepID=A0A9P7YY94_9HELO|nr:putative Exoglucanase 3 [Calycina marina]
MTDIALKAKAAAVTNVGRFVWLHDCAAKASNGELAVGQLSTYKPSYIDPNIKAYPSIAIALVIELDSLPNLVTNANLTTCQQSAQDYKVGVVYALKQLNLPNVAMYIDTGHGGWLGWDANLPNAIPIPGEVMITSIYKTAGSLKQVFGIATNVAGWNAFSPIARPARQHLRQHLLSTRQACHAIVDTGRNSVTAVRKEWGDWYNVNVNGVAFKPSSPGGQCNEAYLEMLIKNTNPTF